MNGKVCFFIGHRDTPEHVYPALEQAVEQLITQGVTEFYVGNHGSFDRMAARGVIAAKQHHPQVRLTMLLAYHPGERPVTLPPGFDGSLYPPGMENVPRRFAIASRQPLDGGALHPPGGLCDPPRQQRGEGGGVGENPRKKSS